MPNQRLAIDVGGTFVDFVLLDEATGQVAIEKVPSSGKLEERFFEGIERLELKLDDLHMLIHGSTLVINTILQENGARVGLITTRGFRDVLELGRGNRAEIYNLFYKPPPPLIPRYLRHEVPERINARGEVLQALDEAAARRVALRLKEHGVAGVAVCFLHAYVNAAHEQRMADILAEAYPEARVSLSSNVAREWREYERTSTTALNVYVMPRMAAYLSKLEEGLRRRRYRGSFNVMQSSGGMTTGTAAQGEPIRTLQSGPAGGVIGAAALGAKLQVADLVSADVGGTSFDVALIAGGRPSERSEARVNGRPVLQSTLDMVSIGAGGGSVAWLDDERGLRVGPHSAEADPGPACFGLGGEQPTVTDAQVILGYLNPDYYLGRRMVLDRKAAEAAITARIAEPLGLTTMAAAQGIVHLTNMNMTYAIRNITIERGHDPRRFSLVCFGGGGGLFAGALMRELEMARAIIPVNPANFSAWGLLNADFREDFSLTRVCALADLPADELSLRLADLGAEAVERLKQNGVSPDTIVVEQFADLRYLGQEHTVKVPIQPDDLRDPALSPLRARFDALHEKAYAHALPEMPVEMVNLRLSAVGVTRKPETRELPERPERAESARKSGRRVFFEGSAVPVECSIYDRTGLGPGHRLEGPAIVEEWTSTTLVLPGQRLEVDSYGNLVLTAI